jgi:hypothetical protein
VRFRRYARRWPRESPPESRAVSRVPNWMSPHSSTLDGSAMCLASVASALLSLSYLAPGSASNDLGRISTYREALIDSVGGANHERPTRLGVQIPVTPTLAPEVLPPPLAYLRMPFADCRPDPSMLVNLPLAPRMEGPPAACPPALGQVRRRWNPRAPLPSEEGSQVCARGGAGMSQPGPCAAPRLYNARTALPPGRGF